MSVFSIKVASNHHSATYEIVETSHNDAAINAAITALKTFASHGHGRFPYSDNQLTITVSEVPA